MIYLLAALAVVVVSFVVIYGIYNAVTFKIEKDDVDPPMRWHWTVIAGPRFYERHLINDAVDEFRRELKAKYPPS